MMKFNSYDISENRNYLYAIMIIWIVFFHIFLYINIFPDNLLRLIMINGNIGVDVFLFLSGISLYFSYKNNNEKIIDFYKKRFIKLGLVYLFIVIPAQIIMSQIYDNYNGGDYWFLLCILICYFIYPLLYYPVKHNKKYINIIISLGLIVALMLFNYLIPKTYFEIERLITRIPIFVFGTAFGKEVYQKKKISGNFVLFCISLILITNPVFFFLKKIFNNSFDLLFYRISLGIIGVGVIFLLLILLKCFDNIIIKKFLNVIGKITLEIYVVHVSLLTFFLNYLNLTFNKVSYAAIFSIFFFILSVFISIIFNKLIEKTKLVLEKRKII